MRLRSPLKPRGAHALKWGKWQDKCRTIVQRRARGRCEACGRMAPLEWAHLAGRSSSTAEPWASSPELTMGLCRTAYGTLGCHERIDRALNLDLRDMLRWKAVRALMERYQLGWLLSESTDDRPLDVIRDIVRKVEEEGWAWDPEACDIRQT